jgi:5-methylcytosine-specific restriction endonuclease McrA
VTANPIDRIGADDELDGFGPITFEEGMKEPVLVLNANFAPINVCTTRRAIVLVLTGKASLVINGRGYIKTISRTYPRPSIIRLGTMIKRPRPRVSLNRREILRRDNYTCQYCGTRTGNLTIDHVYPKHLGGEHSWENLVTACSVCNHIKGGRTLDQAGLQLRSTPREPSLSAEYIFSRHTKQNLEWVPFLEGW